MSHADYSVLLWFSATNRFNDVAFSTIFAFFVSLPLFFVSNRVVTCECARCKCKHKWHFPNKHRHLDDPMRMKIFHNAKIIIFRYLLWPSSHSLAFQNRRYSFYSPSNYPMSFTLTSICCYWIGILLSPISAHTAHTLCVTTASVATPNRFFGST